MYFRVIIIILCYFISFVDNLQLMESNDNIIRIEKLDNANNVYNNEIIFQNNKYYKIKGFFGIFLIPRK